MREKKITHLSFQLEKGCPVSLIELIGLETGVCYARACFRGGLLVGRVNGYRNEVIERWYSRTIKKIK